MKKNKKTLIAGLVIVLLLIVVVAACLLRKYSPNKAHMGLDEYFNKTTENGNIPVILEDKQYKTKAMIQDGQVYVGIDFVKEQLNKRFYWDGNENQLLYTTATQEISTPLNSKDCYVNKSKDTKQYVIATAKGDDIYVALDYVKLYTALDYKTYSKPDRVVINNVYGKDITYSKVKSDTQLRYKATIKSKILQDLKQGDTVRVLKQDKDSDFMQVMSESGVTGYVAAKKMQSSYKEQRQTDFREEVYSHILMDDKVSMVWHQVTNKSANSGLSDLLSATKGVNVVSPTWFETTDNEGNITSLASDTYVDTAHRAGVQVWALCSDFGPKMKIGKVLEKTSTRQKLARNLVAEVIRYSLDGINIDFENVKKDSGEDFIQFIRELSIMCRNNGIVLSIDNYPPVGDLSSHYDRAEQAAVADYVVTMAYDEHYAGSQEAGPVSSISYVTNALEQVSKEVPAEQMVMGLPFYSRHWKEKTKDGTTKLSSEACSMKGAQEVVKDSGKDAVWNDETGTYYAEYTQDGVIHKIWVEDAKSLELKLKAVSEAKVGGVSFWKLGLEDTSVWNMIEKYVKN